MELENGMRVRAVHIADHADPISIQIDVPISGWCSLGSKNTASTLSCLNEIMETLHGFRRSDVPNISVQNFLEVGFDKVDIAKCGYSATELISCYSADHGYFSLNFLTETGRKAQF